MVYYCITGTSILINTDVQHILCNACNIIRWLQRLTCYQEKYMYMIWLVTSNVLFHYLLDRSISISFFKTWWIYRHKKIENYFCCYCIVISSVMIYHSLKFERLKHTINQTFRPEINLKFTWKWHEIEVNITRRKLQFQLNGPHKSCMWIQINIFTCEFQVNFISNVWPALTFLLSSVKFNLINFTWNWHFV